MKKSFFLIIIFIGINIFIANSVGVKSSDASLIDSTMAVKPPEFLSNEDQLINTILARYHYKKFDLDDSLSSVIFDRFLKSLDFSRTYFYADDIKNFEQFRYKLDNYLQEGNVAPPYIIFNVFRDRVNERIDHVKKIIDKGFDFTIDENYLIDRENAPWVKTEEEMNDLWRKRIKNDALNLILAGKNRDSLKTTLLKRYENFQRAITQYNSEDVFQLYMNSYTEAIDPHTNYLSPITSENFKIDMSRSLEGIGAQLQQEDEYTKVAAIIPGGPAYKSGLLKQNDKIIGVGQDEDGEIVDVIGWRITDVVQLIRGPKGTTVRLEIIPAGQAGNAIPKEIKIIRDKVTLEEQSAKKSVLNIKNNNTPFKIGIISIPAFYIDFEARQKGDPDYKSTTRDVKELLDSLKNENVDGIVIDLRNNGGGSLDEAINMVGLFIKNGPVVQVRNADGKIDVGKDYDEAIAYDGPLAVLVNRFSASASEIFAGAIQDYGRGIVVGENTYGKGTVQNLIDLNRLVRSSDEFGQVKLTIAKYYRINGGSTQNKGVLPDITLPSAIDAEEFGESSEPSALPWDQIKTTDFKKFSDLQKYIPQLRKMHQKRMDSTSTFDGILEDIQEYKEAKSKKYISLNEEVRKKEKEKLEDERFQRENERRKNKGLKLLKKDEDLTKNNSSEDPYLDEAAHIIADYILMTIG